MGAVFELDYIIVREKGTKSPPRGVQLQLGAHHGGHVDDTLIMENLIGYLLGYSDSRCVPIHEGRRREVFSLDRVL